MALSGSFYGTTANARIKPKITWWAVQSAEGNYSDITATLSYSRTNAGYKTGGDWKGAITIGGQTTSGSKKDIAITYESNTEVLTATARMYHDENGLLSVTISAEGQIPGTTLESTSISGVIALDEIARAATLSATNGDIEAVSTIVVAQKNAAYVHSIQYRFGTLSGYINAYGDAVASEVRFANTTINFQIPSDFYFQIPDKPSGVCTLVCCTYSGDTQIGTEQTAEFTVTADPFVCRPVVSGTVADSNAQTAALTGDPGTLVQYASKARCAIAAQARSGASIVTLRIGGVEVDAQTGVLEIANPSFHQITFEAVDSRGYTASCVLPVELVPYTELTNNARIQRTDPTSGDALLTLQGSCWFGNFGAGDNALAASIQVNAEDPTELQLEIGTDGKYFAEVTLSGLDYTKAHTVNVVVTDSASSASVSLPVQKGIPVFDWGESDFQFHVPVDLPALTVGGIPLADYIRNIIES